VVPGYSRGSFLSQALNIVCRGVVIFLRDTRISASPAPMRPDVLCIKLMALYGRPMLSRMLSTSRSGISRRIEPSTRVAQLRGLFDSRAAPGAQMEDELTAVRVRKKVLTEPRHKEKRPQRRSEERWGRRGHDDGQAPRGGPGRHSEAVRTRVRMLAGTAREDSVNQQRQPALLSAGIWPA